MGKSIIIISMIAVSALLGVVVGRERALTLVFGPLEIKEIDFASLVLGPKPNQFLVCPVDYCSAKPHMLSPVFPISANDLQQRWMALMKTQARVEAGAVDVEAMQYDFIQRSALMRYPDSITVRFIALEDDRASLVIYSRSHYGKSDLGVNESRIRAWISDLEHL